MSEVSTGVVRSIHCGPIPCGHYVTSQPRAVASHYEVIKGLQTKLNSVRTSSLVPEASDESKPDFLLPSYESHFPPNVYEPSSQLSPNESHFDPQLPPNVYQPDSQQLPSYESHFGSRLPPNDSQPGPQLPPNVSPPSADRPFKCALCTAQFTQKGNLTVHERTHTGERPYKCDACDYTATRRHHLTQHAARHSTELTLKCGVCSWSGYKSHLKAHMREHKGPFTCQTCDRKYSRYCNLAVHLGKHADDPEPFKCNRCQFSTAEKSELTVHQMIHTIETTIEHTVKPYQCTVCDWRARKLSSLVVHMRNHSGIRPFPCEICDKRFAQHRMLKTHKKVHGKQGLYTCDKCTFTAAENTELVTHLKSHREALSSEEKSFWRHQTFTRRRTFSTCKICDKRFTQRSILKNHEKVHKNRKGLYTCNKCTYTTTVKTELVTHLKSHRSGALSFEDQSFWTHQTLLMSGFLK